MRRFTGWALAALAIMGCGESTSSGGAGDTGAGDAGGAPTFYGDVAPIFARRCGGCHVEGGAGPFPLLDAENARAYGVAALAAIESGRMPPWNPDPDCRRYRDERLMPDEEKDAVRRWVEAGMPAGVGAPVAPPAGDDLGRPAIVAKPLEPYTGDPARPDDYRCFPLDAEFPEETYVIANNVVPGDRRTVHHVLVFVVEARRAQDLADMDAADEGPGYQCYGGAGVNSGGPLAGWVPGQSVFRFDTDTAAVVPAGSRLVMQVHYNFLASEPSPDLTEFHLYTRPEPPRFVSRAHPLANFDLRIPAGAAESTHVKDFVNRSGETWVIGGTAPHMHTLGRKIRTEVVHADGSSTCLVDIPRWDFNWQQAYVLPQDQQVTVRPGETMRLTCTFDNSPSAQPVVNGERRPPRDVTWGEGTLDEMCLNFVHVIEPYRADAGGTCGGFDACRSGCADPTGVACAFDCMTLEQACAQCVFPAFAGEGGCARETCGAQLAAASDCIRACAVQAIGAGGGMDACLAQRCPAERDALYACVDPLLRSGACDDPLSTCDIQR